MEKTHVEHAVGLIQHEHLHGREVEFALLLQVEQTARRCHQNIDAFSNAGNLGVHADTTKNDGGSQLQVFTVGADRFFNLRGKFTGGGEHQGAHTVDAKFVLGAATHGELVQHGQGKGCGFACAGLGAGKQVLAS